MKFDVKIKNNTGQQIASIERQLRALPKEAYDFFVKKTPIDTGNARRKTSQRGNTIQAKYPYAQRLDNGWSKQAPDGMVKPTEQFVKNRLKQIKGK